MDDPNMTMEEYIKFEEEKARRRGRVFNWQTAIYGKIRVDDDLYDFRSVEAEFPAINEFPAIVYYDAQTSKSDLLTKPILNPLHMDELNLNGETSLSEYDKEEQNILDFNDLFPFNIIYPNDSKSDKDNDDDKVDIEHSFRDLSIKPLPDIFYTAYPNPMDTAYRLSGRYPVFIFSTVYTMYSLKEYSVYRYQYGVSWGMDIAYRLLVQF
ncbi:hypothetical protein Tco_1347242 [Tanacetum coccineum]